MSAAAWKVTAVFGLLLLVMTGCAVWKTQDWRYGKQLANQARIYGDTLNELTLAAATRQRADQEKRLALEQRLETNDQTHYKALTDAQKDQVRLRNRLATADLRLSVLLDADSASGCAVPTASGTSGVDHGAPRARLDPAHAQRIIGIAGAGDQGLIALQACQAYIRAIVR